MLTFDQILFNWQSPTLAEDRKNYVGVALGIDDNIEYTFGTYLPIYELLSLGHTFVDKSNEYNDDKYYIGVIDGETELETLEVPQIIWALLLSECEVIEAIRDASIENTIESFGTNYYVGKGWTYVKINNNYTLTPPENWSLPPVKTDEENLAYYQTIVSKITSFIEKNPNSDRFYQTSLDSVTISRDKYLKLVEEKNE